MALNKFPVCSAWGGRAAALLVVAIASYGASSRLASHPAAGVQIGHLFSAISLHAAMERAVKPGHPRGMNADQDTKTMKLWLSGNISKSEMARKYGIHISSINRPIRRKGLMQSRPKRYHQLSLSI